MSPLEATILLALAIWSGFYLVNHADLTARLRAAVMPVLPGWLAYIAQCAFCSTAWLLVAFSLFTGWTPLVLWTPPVVLGMDLAYRRTVSQPVAAAPVVPGQPANTSTPSA